MAKQSTWEIYHGSLGHWRFDDGETLQTIGDRANITREGVRQILQDKYGTTSLRGSMLLESEVANLIGVPVSRLSKLRLSGELKPEQYDSMEQLWLAFCMFERFGKKWDGENWV